MHALENEAQPDLTNWRSRLGGPNSALTFSLYALGVSVLEVCAYVFKGPFSVVASHVWLLGGLVFLAHSLKRIWAAFRRDLSEGFYWGFVATLVAAGLTFWKLQSFSYFFNGEAAREISLGLDYWTQPDFAYTACGHYCYPSRQFLLAALPAMLLGRNLISLRLGFMWMFFLGLLVFYTGLREKLRDLSNGGSLAAIGMLSVLTFGYVVFWLPQDQGIMPVAVTLAAVGWFLLVLVETEPITALCLSWIGAMLATAYTPSLATWALAIGMLLLTATAKLREGKKRDATLLLLATLIIVSFGLSSFMTRGDIQLHLYQERRVAVQGIWDQIAGGFEGYFFSSVQWEGQVFMSHLWLLPLDVYLLTSLLWRNGAAHFFNSAWALAVVGAAVYMQGHSITGPNFELQKAMVTIPPLIAGTLILAAELLERAHFSLRRSAGALLLLVAIYAGWSRKHVHETFFDPKDRRLYEGVEWLLTVANERGVVDGPIDVYIFSHYDFNAQDYLGYFFPKFQTLFRDEGQCFGKFVPTRNAIILYDDDGCQAQLNEIRAAHAGFHELPVQHGFKGFVFIAKTSTPSDKAESAAGG